VRLPVSRDGLAKYLLIADDLRTGIMSGALAPGARLPGENELMRRHAVARMTARQALAVLQSEGLTVARRGAGVFVRDVRPVRRRAVEPPTRAAAPVRPVDDLLLLDGLPVTGAGAASSAAAWQVRSPFATDDGGRALALDRVEVHPDAATPVVAGALAVPAGTGVWVRSRRMLIDGKPAMLATSYVPADLAEGTPITEPDAGPGGVHARLAEFGHPPVRLVEELRARMPLRQEAAELQLPAGTAVIVLCRTAFDATGRPVEFTKLTLDADAYVLEYGIPL
jgi:GntR family transcriptional regulator